jgi:two-component system, OmpR family, sensor kinase
MRSVRRTLVAALLAAVLAVMLLGAIAAYRTARQELDALFDYQLRQLALSLSDRVLAQQGAARAREDFDFVVQIWDRDGARLYISRPEARLPEVAELGFADVRAPSGDWRVYSAALGEQVIQVAQPLRVRERLAFAAAGRTLLPVLLALPLLALVIWRVVGRGLAPLDRLARAAEARTATALAPFDEAGVPDEALPLVRALNALLERLRVALAAQRAFVADAAHELRTPLAALRTQLQLAQRAPEGERAAALRDLDAAVDRGARLVQQLLALARAEPEAAGARPSVAVRLAELVRQAVADHAVVAEARGVDLGAAEVSEEAVVAGDADGLRTLLANLVDNAVRHTPEGGQVDVSAGVSDGRPWLGVADTGPGIPAAERARVFDRFYRPAGTEAPGSGLGLAIVRAIAHRHGAEVTLADRSGGGLAARVTFPAPAAARPTWTEGA